MKTLIILLLSFLTISAYSQKVVYKKITTDSITKKTKTVDITKEFKKLQDSLVIIKALKYKPNIYMPIFRYDSGQYKWAGVFKPLKIENSMAYIVVVNPSENPIDYKYNAACNTYSSFVPSNVRMTIISNKDSNDEWMCDKKNYMMKYQGDSFYITIPEKSFCIFTLER